MFVCLFRNHLTIPFSAKLGSEKAHKEHRHALLNASNGMKSIDFQFPNSFLRHHSSFVNKTNRRPLTKGLSHPLLSLLCV